MQWVHGLIVSACGVVALAATAQADTALFDNGVPGIAQARGGGVGMTNGVYGADDFTLTTSAEVSGAVFYITGHNDYWTNSPMNWVIRKGDGFGQFTSPPPVNVASGTTSLVSFEKQTYSDPFVVNDIYKVTLTFAQGTTPEGVNLTAGTKYWLGLSSPSLSRWEWVLADAPSPGDGYHWDGVGNNAFALMGQAVPLPSPVYAGTFLVALSLLGRHGFAVKRHRA